MSQATYERVLRAMERYGFGITLSIAILWFARTDIILPMVESHRVFLNELATSNREMARTQAEISRAMNDQARTLETQTRLLYSICPRVGALPQDEPGEYVHKPVEEDSGG